MAGGLLCGRECGFVGICGPLGRLMEGAAVRSRRAARRAASRPLPVKQISSDIARIRKRVQEERGCATAAGLRCQDDSDGEGKLEIQLDKAFLEASPVIEQDNENIQGSTGLEGFERELWDLRGRGMFHKVIDAVESRRLENQGDLSRIEYHLFFESLVELKEFDRCFHGWEALRESLSTETHSLVLQALGRAGYGARMVSIIEYVKSATLGTPEDVINSIFQSALQGASAREGYYLVTQALHENVFPELKICERVLSQLTRQRKIEQATELVVLMGSKNLAPSAKIFNGLLDVSRQSQRFDLSWSLMQQVDRAGNISLSSTVCENLLIRSAKCLSSKDALTFKDALEQLGFQCGSGSYTELIGQACKAGELELGFNLYSEVLSRGIRPTAEMFTSLIYACGKVRALDKAFDTHEHMILCGIEPTTVTFNALMNGCRLAGDVERILQVIDMMEYSGVSPDVISYSALVDAYGRIGRVEDAFATVDLMIARGVEPSAVTFTHLINASSRAGHIDAAFKVVELMKERDMRPNVFTYSSLINGLAKRGEFTRALQVLEDMRAGDVQPTGVTYVTLLKTCKRLYDQHTTSRILDMLEKDLEKLDRTSLKQLLSVHQDQQLQLRKTIMDKIDMLTI